MQYRASFLMQTLGHFLITGIEFLAIWALFERFGSLKGWTLPQVAFFYGMVTIAFSINDTLTRGFDIVGRLIKSGDFDRMLLRPRSTVLQLMGYEFTLKRFGRFSQGLAVLIWSALSLRLDWNVGKLFFVLWTLMGSTSFFIGLLIIQATVAFWTTESLEIMNTLTYGGIETAQFPMSIYLPWFRRFFTFVVPLACVNYFPILAIIEKPDPLGSPLWFHHLAPAAGLLFLAVGTRLWRFGLRHYSSTGS
jgi:ABC-2 type transport system permease protein